MTHSETRELFIYDVAVALERQRTGVDRALIQFVRQAARSEGLSSVFVLASNEDTHAISFYESVGLEAEGFTLFGSHSDPG